MSDRMRPASLRAVTTSSWRRGWRSTSAAHSAPAKPDAPTTATLATELPPGFRELRLDPAAHLSHLVVSQGAVGRAELEPQCERLVPLAHLLAAIDVEQPHTLEQLTAGGTHGRLDVGIRDVVGHDDRYVLDHGGERRYRPVSRRL